jgi:hypothetical protein
VPTATSTPSRPSTPSTVHRHGGHRDRPEVEGSSRRIARADGSCARGPRPSRAHDARPSTAMDRAASPGVCGHAAVASSSRSSWPCVARRRWRVRRFSDRAAVAARSRRRRFRASTSVASIGRAARSRRCQRRGQPRAALWCGIDVPADAAPGVYRATATSRRRRAASTGRDDPHGVAHDGARGGASRGDDAPRGSIRAWRRRTPSSAARPSSSRRVASASSAAISIRRHRPAEADPT